MGWHASTSGIVRTGGGFVGQVVGVATWLTLALAHHGWRGRREWSLLSMFRRSQDRGWSVWSSGTPVIAPQGLAKAHYLLKELLPPKRLGQACSWRLGGLDGLRLQKEFAGHARSV